MLLPNQTHIIGKFRTKHKYHEENKAENEENPVSLEAINNTEEYFRVINIMNYYHTASDEYDDAISRYRKLIRTLPEDGLIWIQ